MKSLRNAVGLILIATVAPASAQELQLQQDDLILGLGRSDGFASVELIRGPVQELGGSWQDGPYRQPFIQGIEFDNLNGISHNPAGNLLGVNYGPSDGGGEVYALPTCTAEQAGTLLANTEGVGGAGLTLSNLAGLSVSPDNSKIAVMGYDSGAILIFDYTAGDCTGAGVTLANGRETDPILTIGSTQGSTWLDNDSILTFSSTGDLLAVDAVTLQSRVLTNIDTGREPGTSSEFADVEYNPLISPYIYVSFSTFADVSTNSLYVLDPQNGYELVANIDNSNSMDTAREIALDSQGNLYLGQFGGSIDVIVNAADPSSLQNDSTLDWYIATTTASFSGLDIAVGLSMDPANDAGDFNGNGQLDANDIDLLSNEVRQGTNASEFDLNDDSLVDQADRDVWVVDLKQTYYGDADLNGQFDSADLVVVLAAGEYEDTLLGNSGWATGDWNGDAEFTSDDLVTAVGGGGYEQGPPAASAVPEPTGLWWLLPALVPSLVRCRRAW